MWCQCIFWNVLLQYTLGIILVISVSIPYPPPLVSNFSLILAHVEAQSLLLFGCNNAITGLVLKAASVCFCFALKYHYIANSAQFSCCDCIQMLNEYWEEIAGWHAFYWHNNKQEILSHLFFPIKSDSLWNICPLLHIHLSHSHFIPWLNICFGQTQIELQWERERKRRKTECWLIISHLPMVMYMQNNVWPF